MYCDLASLSRPANPIIQIIGFHTDFVKICAMHTLNLGVVQLHNGSVYTLLTELGCLLATSYTSFLGFIMEFCNKI